MSPEEVEGITGKSIPQNLSRISNMYDFQVKYDVRELDTAFVIEKLKAYHPVRASLGQRWRY